METAVNVADTTSLIKWYALGKALLAGSSILRSIDEVLRGLVSNLVITITENNNTKEK